MALHSPLACILVSCLLATACTSLPETDPQPTETALSPAPDGAPANLAHRVESEFGAGQSGFLLLPEAKEALQWRLALVDVATRSIDIQYFIWQGDDSGNLLFSRLLEAADRGIRVRLLVDDLVLTSSDKDIGYVSRHPNISIRLFNPGRSRGSAGTLGDFVLRFDEFNRRMHNKLFAVDNQVAVIGGRNIGDPYFGLSEKYNFSDLDVLIAGPMVSRISTAFDLYWNSELAFPGSAFATETSDKEAAELLEEVRSGNHLNRDILSSYAVDDRDWATDWDGLISRMEGGDGYFIQDVPVDVHGENLRLVDMLDHVSGPTETELLISSPYLIPRQDFLDGLSRLTEKGVAVRILTAGLDSNNHTAAHSHYRKYRRQILETGAELFEMRSQPSSAVREEADVAPVRSKFISLHAKTMSADDERCFIGSLNLDPRAVEINTENGAYIESPGLCSRLGGYLRTLMQPDNAWRVFLDDGGELAWESSEGTVNRQPARGALQRISDGFFGILPIEDQL